MTIRVRIRFFASLTELVGSEEKELLIQSPATIAQVESLLLEEYPALQERTFRWAKNHEFVEGDVEVVDGDELACIPPVSGGERPYYAFVTSEPLVPSDILEQVRDPGQGANVMFVGTIRDLHEGLEVEGVEYEVYAEMVISQMEDLLAEAVKQFDLHSLVVGHRQGYVAQGEPAIVVACSSRHRQASLAALPWIMDEFKQRIPIWKKEKGSWGETWLEGGERRDIKVST